MDDKTRQSLGGLCVALALLAIGMLVRFGYNDLDVIGGALILAGAVAAVVSLLRLAVDLMRPTDRSPLDR